MDIENENIQNNDETKENVPEEISKEMSEEVQNTHIQNSAVEVQSDNKEPLESKSTLIETEVKSVIEECVENQEKDEDFVDNKEGSVNVEHLTEENNTQYDEEYIVEEMEQYETAYNPIEIFERYERGEYDGEYEYEEMHIDEKNETRKLIKKLMAAMSYSSIEEDQISDHLKSLETEKRLSIDRETYLAEYNKLLEEQQPIRRQNGYLNKKMTEYLKKRKMDHCLKEAPPAEADELKEKYERKLNSLYDYDAMVKREKEIIKSDLEDMTNQRNELKFNKEELFEGMKIREKDISKNLVDARTGKILSDKVVEKLISRQSGKLDEISKIRLDYIKQREKVKQLEIALKALETIGGNLHLIDYEQLRIENQNYADKIEERDDELNRLRVRCSEAVTTLAHIREKSHRIDNDFIEQSEDCLKLENEISEYREILNDLKLKRDRNRSETLKLRAESGLLTYPKLLTDMKNSIIEVNELTKELDNLKEEYRFTQKKLYLMRRLIVKYGHMEKIKSMQINEKYRSSLKAFHRPTLMKTHVAINKKQIDKELYFSH